VLGASASLLRTRLGRRRARLDLSPSRTLEVIGGSAFAGADNTKTAVSRLVSTTLRSSTMRDGGAYDTPPRHFASEADVEG